MKLVILSDAFYLKYGNCKEVLDKADRPYCCVTMKIEDHLFAIPLRHHIHHAYAFHTINDAGLDYTKAVPVDDPSFVSDDKPQIDSKEWGIIRSNEDSIYKGFSRYIRQYKRAIANISNPRSIRLIKYSSLQYFNL